MSEVEKMYENAGVEKVCTHTIINPEKCNHRRMTRCCGCDWLELPPFTAEKQIELIKWLARFNVRIECTEYINAKYFIESHYHGYSVYIARFEQALACFINILWQDLTETERNEIRDILKG